MNMQIEDARLICPCLVHSGVCQEPAKVPGARERSARLLLVALVLATATLGFSVVNPSVTTLVPAERRTAGLVKVDIDPVQVPSLATGLRNQFSNTPSAEELAKVRKSFFESKVPYGTLIYTEATRNGLEPELVAAVVRAESGFYPDRVSVKNAIGLMQVIPSTGELMGAGDLTDPVENVRAGTKYLRYLESEFDGDQILTLAAYNSGEGTVRRYDGVPPYRETQEYVRKVGQYRHAYARTIERLAVAQRGVSAAR